MRFWVQKRNPASAPSRSSSELTLPSEKAASARERWFCERLPWMAAARTPARASFLATASVPCLVRQNTIVAPSLASMR